MSQLEYLRENLHKIMESGNTEDILKVSQELDNLILIYMKSKTYVKKLSA